MVESESNLGCRCPTCGTWLAEHPDPREILQTLQVGPQVRLLLERLVRSFGSWVPSATLVELICANATVGARRDQHREDGGPLTANTMVNVLVSHARRALRPTALRLETGWGQKRLCWKEPE